MSHLSSGKTVIWYIGWDESTVFTNVSLPAEDKNLPFHPGNLAPILSKSGWTSIFLSLRT
jgi:hypothetical protein